MNDAKRRGSKIDENDAVQPNQDPSSFLNQWGNCHQNDLTNQSSPLLTFAPANTLCISVRYMWLKHIHMPPPWFLLPKWKLNRAECNRHSRCYEHPNYLFNIVLKAIDKFDGLWFTYVDVTRRDHSLSSKPITDLISKSQQILYLFIKSAEKCWSWMKSWI